MEKSDVEKHAYGALERFLYIFLLPVLFTLVLVGALLTLFDYDVKGALTDIGRSIPIVKSFMPEKENGLATTAGTTLLLEEQMANLEGELAAKDAEIATLRSQLLEKEEAFHALEANVEQLVLSQEQILQNREEYRAQLKALANMYTGMSASRAAAILERMTLPELVLILYEMSTEDRGTILARMDPEKAASASLELKDMTESNWAEYEQKARESRGSADAAGSPASAGSLSAEELAGTFAAMAPDRAATILLELKKQNSNRAVTVLAAMSEQARSRVLAAISETSPEEAAAFADALGGR